jgi:peptidoglycan/xylan/chitin deacetylase (PgdA/CDA1 family)
MTKTSTSRHLLTILIAALLAWLLVGCAASDQDGGEHASDTPPAPQEPAASDEPLANDPLDNEPPANDGTSEVTPPEANEPSASDPDTAPSKKRVARSFDDGPHNVHTKSIVDELAKYGARATFFVVGNRVDGSAYNGRAGIEYAIANGHEIAIHGYTHTKYYNRCSEQEYYYELSQTLAAIRSISPSAEVNLMRPIGGSITGERVESCPYAVVLWDVDSEDWKNKYTSEDSDAQKQAKAALIANNILSTVKEGSIILMHDIYAGTCDALRIVLERLYAQGYEVVTVSELLGDTMASGQKYYSAR